MMKKHILHPFLAPLFIIFYLYSFNIGVMPLMGILRPITIVLLTTVVIWYFLNLLVKDKMKSGVIVTILFLFNCVFFAVWGYRSDLKYSIFLFAVVIIAVILIVRITRAKFKVQILNHFLNIFLIVLSLFPLSQILYSSVFTDTNWLENRTNNYEMKTVDSCPNIYFIVLDAYAGKNILERVGFDNSPFLNGLKNKGFFVADNGNSNYNYTYLSLSTVLNFSYLNDISDKMGRTSRNRAPLIELINDSRVFRQLKDNDYKIITFSTGDSGTEIRSSDKYFSLDRGVTQFESMLLLLTPVRFFEKNLILYKKNLHKDQIMFTLDKVKESVDSKHKPVFVFAHIICPHFPFVLGQDENSTDDVDRYLKQLNSLNSEVTKVVDYILANSTEPPIIILQSDHGPGYLDDWKKRDPNNLSIWFSNLNAIYYPDQDYSQLYDSMSPVNTFRLVFNHLFGTNYELLEDKCFYVEKDNLYDFKDVTNEVIRIP